MWDRSEASPGEHVRDLEQRLEPVSVTKGISQSAGCQVCQGQALWRGFCKSVSTDGSAPALDRA
jgi:hypothetical protein